MDFTKLKKLDKRGSMNIAGDMTQLLMAIILIGIFSVIVIAIILAFAPLIQDQAADAANNSSGVVKTLWEVVSSDNVVEILFITAYIVIVISVLIAIVNNAVKRIK